MFLAFDTHDLGCFARKLHNIRTSAKMMYDGSIASTKSFPEKFELLFPYYGYSSKKRLSNQIRLQLEDHETVSKINVRYLVDVHISDRRKLSVIVRFHSNKLLVFSLTLQITDICLPSEKFSLVGTIDSSILSQSFTIMNVRHLSKHLVASDMIQFLNYHYAKLNGDKMKIKCKCDDIKYYNHHNDIISTNNVIDNEYHGDRIISARQVNNPAYLSLITIVISTLLESPEKFAISQQLAFDKLLNKAREQIICE